MEDFKRLVTNLSELKNFYDIVRIVDPLKKEVICSYDRKTFQMGCEGNQQPCHLFWNLEGDCKNCISIRALAQDDTFIKIERKGSQKILQISTPFLVGDRKCVLEVFKDVSESGIFKDLEETRREGFQQQVPMASDLAVIDELTQIHNRRFINKQIPLYVIKNHLEGTPISVIMADIDRFKAVNDRYGHICGDCVLKQFAGILADSVRTDNGIVARYGGDEFLILLDRTDGKTAFNISEKLRKTIENACFPYETHQIKITASFGIYMIDENCVSIDKIINHVDKKLYQAKKAGRNKSAK